MDGDSDAPIEEANKLEESDPNSAWPWLWAIFQFVFVLMLTYSSTVCLHKNPNPLSHTPKRGTSTVRLI